MKFEQRAESQSDPRDNSIPRTVPATEELRALQYSGEITNLPAGERTETPIYAVSDIPRIETVQPTLVEKYLKQDREELASISLIATDQLGQPITPLQSLGMITAQMGNLMKQAHTSLIEADERNSNRIALLNICSRALEVNERNWSYQIPKGMGFVKIATAEEYINPKDGVRPSIFSGYTHLQFGDRLFSLNNYCREKSPLQELMKEAADTLDKFSYNRRNSPSADEVKEILQKVSASSHLQEQLLSPESTSFENDRYKIDSIYGHAFFVRANSDLIIAFKNNSGEEDHIRLNSIQLRNAVRGIFPKFDKENPPVDPQQRMYPTSPIQFWHDHLAHLQPAQLSALLS